MRGRLLLVFSGLVVGALLSEGALRIVEPGKRTLPAYGLSLYDVFGEPISRRDGPLRLVLDPFTVYRHRPNQNEAAFHINTLGLRGPLPAADGRLRALLLGGSAAFGVGATSDGTTIAAHLDRLAPRWQVLNAGMVGFHSGQELALLVSQGLDLAPTTVISYSGWNDLFGSLQGPERPGERYGFNGNFYELNRVLATSHRAETSLAQGFFRVLRTMARSSRLYARLSAALGGNEPETAEGAPGRFSPDRLEAVVAGYVRNVRVMNQLCRGGGIRFLLALQPELGQRPAPTKEEHLLLEQGLGVTHYARDFPRLYRRFLQRVHEELPDLELVDINQTPEFRDSTATLFIDAVHTNDEGNRIVADILKGHLHRESE